MSGPERLEGSIILPGTTQRATRGRNLFLAVDVPVEDLGEDLLAVALDGVAVAGDEGGEIPTVDALGALVEAGAVLVAVADGVPEEALVALGGAGGAVERVEDLLEQAAALLLGLGHLGVLLRGRKVEHEVGLDQDLLGLVEQDDLLVRVGVDHLDLEVGGELVADGGRVRVGLVVQEVEVLLADHRVVHLLPALGQALGADQLGRRVLGLPLRDEDVVLEIAGDDVADSAAELGDLGLDLVGEGDGGEDGESTGRELDYLRSFG